jgi:hypothetical protein
MLDRAKPKFLLVVHPFVLFLSLSLTLSLTLVLSLSLSLSYQGCHDFLPQTLFWLNALANKLATYSYCIPFSSFLQPNAQLNFVQVERARVI